MILSTALCLHLLLPPVPYRHTIRSLSCRFGVDPRLVAAIVSTESHFRRIVRVREPDGRYSYGLMQVKAETARMMGFRGSPRRLYSPWLNLYYGIRYLKSRLQHYPFVWDAVSAYNAGHPLWHDLSYRNRRYVRRVWRRYHRLTGTPSLPPEEEKILVRLAGISSPILFARRF